MPGIFTTILRQQIRLLKPVFTRFSIPAARNLQEALGNLGAKTVEDKVVFSTFRIGEQPAGFAIPVGLEQADPRIALYLHGGGYVAGSIKYAQGFAGVLATKAQVRVAYMAYRLAPEHPYPAALEDALAAYTYLLSQGYPPEQISLIGESAGGGLILCLCLLLQKLGRPLPSKIVALSPWVDLTLSGESYQYNRKADPTLTIEELEGFAQSYGAPDRRDPFVSPLFASCSALSGFPPCRIYAGGDELLLDDAKQMAKALQAAGVDCQLHVEPGLWHGYVLYGIPEANRALAEIQTFLAERR